MMRVHKNWGALARDRALGYIISRVADHRRPGAGGGGGGDASLECAFSNISRIVAHAARARRQIKMSFRTHAFVRVCVRLSGTQTCAGQPVK